MSLNPMNDATDLVDKLKHLGLNTNEAKVYLALLKQHPVTGYELSKNSGVPQARAYETLKSLETKKIVIATSGKPITYVPVPPDDLLGRYEQQFKGAIDYLRQSLPIYTIESVEPVHNLRGPQSIIHQVTQMLGDAQTMVFMEVWWQDAPYFEPALRQAKERGVHVNVVAYGEIHYDDFANVHVHGAVKEVEKSLGGRWLIMSVDNKVGLVGTAPNQNDRTPHAVWTHNPAIVMVIQQLIIHDIYLLDVEATVPDALKKAYGENLLKLRKKVLGDAMLIGAH
jgi:HTH-type transcriptional regulator, sugar sensing transcriptional regulator